MDNQELPQNDQQTAASKMLLASSIKRILSFLWDFGCAMLIARLWIYPVLQPMNWDISTAQTTSLYNWLWIGSVLALIMGKDILGGVSFGRWLFSIRVVVLQQPITAPSFFQSVGRNLFLFFLPIEIGLILWSKHLRRLGDRFIGTAVIDCQPKFSVRKLTHQTLAGIFFFCLLWFGYLISQPIQINKSAVFAIALADVKKSIPQTQQAIDIKYFKELFWQDDQLVLQFDFSTNQNQYETQYFMQKNQTGWKIVERQIELKNTTSKQP